MKKILLLLLVVTMAKGQNSPSIFKSVFPPKAVGQIDLAAGLKEALHNGIRKQVNLLSVTDGFYKNEAVKILLPDELKKVDATMRKLGLSSLADEGLKVLNRAAEEAVKEATPLFVTAITNMNFKDATTILMGDTSAATRYLQTTTSSELYSKFKPVAQASIHKVGADLVWSKILGQYNSLPLVRKVNPDLADYISTKAMSGVFKMIAVEEKNIRLQINSRTSPLLQKVFALQDPK